MPVFAEQKETSISALDRRLSVSEQQVAHSTADRLLASKEDAAASAVSSLSTSSSVQEVEAHMNTQQQQEQEQFEQQGQPQSQEAQQVQEQAQPTSSDNANANANANVNANVSINVANSDESLLPSEETMIFFDWDDTLLASTFLASHGYRLDTDLENKEGYELMQAELKQLEQCVLNVLSEALQRGRVHIITNAEQGWVELSAQKFIPGVLPLLNQIHIISARSTYEHMFPESPLKWKFSAFHERLSDLLSLENITRNVLSFGDSHVEREAVRTVTRGVDNTKTKSIKFTESPTMDQLRKQLELVTSHFHYIYSHEGDLDLMLKMSPVPAEGSNAAC